MKSFNDKIKELEKEKGKLKIEAMSLVNRIKFNLGRWSHYGNCTKIIIDNRLDRKWSLKVYNKLLDEIVELSHHGNIDTQLDNLKILGIPIELGKGAVTLNFFFDNPEVNQLSDNWIPELGEQEVKYYLRGTHTASGIRYAGYGEQSLILQNKIDVLEELQNENIEK